MATTLFFISLLLASVSAQGDKADCTNKDNCNAEEKNQYVIQCVDGSQDCTCTDGTEKCPSDSTPTANSRDECIAACTGNCIFWKFYQFPTYSKCYLMDKDQCDAKSGHDCQESHNCYSGVATDDSCEVPPEPEPEFTCNVGTGGAGMVLDDRKIQWLCHAGGNPLDIVDPYVGTTVPAGTVCTTDHKCKKFEVNGDGHDKLEYSCALKADSGANPVGEWKENGSGHDADALNDDGSLKEPSCDAEPLQLAAASYNQEGLIVQCTDGQVNDDLQLPAPNMCLLLCDYYSVIYIFTDWNLDGDGNETGEQVWFYRIVGDPDKPENNNIVDDNTAPDIVKCW